MSSANPDPVINKSNAIRSLSHSLRVYVPGILINAANGLWWGDTRPWHGGKTDTLANSTCTTAAAIEPHHPVQANNNCCETMASAGGAGGRGRYDRIEVSSTDGSTVSSAKAVRVMPPYPPQPSPQLEDDEGGLVCGQPLNN